MQSGRSLLRMFGAHLTVVLLLFSISPVSMAGLVALNPTGTGSVGKTTAHTVNGTFTYGYTTVNPLSSLAYYPPSGVGMVQGSSVAYGYLLFDLSALSFAANAAAIEFNLIYPRSASPGLTITSLTYSQAVVLSTFPAGSQTLNTIDVINGTPEQQAAFLRVAAAFDAIVGGAALGELAASGPLSGSYSVALNTQALSLINAGPGLLGLGLSWTPHSNFVPGTPPDVDTITFNGAPRLILNSESPVPLPASTWLLGAGLICLRALHRNCNWCRYIMRSARRGLRMPT